jgi:hypothetical protein
LIGSVVLLLWRLIPGNGLVLEIAGVGVAALAYVIALRAMGLDAEERYVWNRIRARAFKGRGGNKKDKEDEDATP